MLRAACKTAIRWRILEVLEEYPMTGWAFRRRGRGVYWGWGCRQSRQLFFNGCMKKQPSVGCNHCQELAPFLPAAAACSHLFQLCSKMKHVKNRNGWKNMQQPLWVEGAKLWHSSRSVWWKAFLPWEGINGRGATCQRSILAISVLFSVGRSDTAVHVLVVAFGSSPTLGFFLKRKSVLEQ